MTCGRANFIADNLIADGACKPMLIVMPNGLFPRMQGFNGNFEKDFFESVIPTVEKNYRVAEGPRNHAMAGLSMGAAQTMDFGLARQDLFAWLGVFSNGVKDDYGTTHGKVPRHGQ